jgi:hypothetical protein
MGGVNWDVARVVQSCTTWTVDERTDGQRSAEPNEKPRVEG